MTDAASRAPMPPAVGGIDCAAFETFLIQEARLLDERRFREWMELFAEDGTYWVPAVPDQASPFDQAFIDRFLPSPCVLHPWPDQRFGFAVL